VELVTDPWGWWVSPFLDNVFMRDALVTGVLTVLTTSLVGTWVVLRGMSFLGDALAHGVLPGIAIAFVLGGSTTIGALVAAVAMVGGVQAIRATSPLPDDASIGVLFVGFLALAVVVMWRYGHRLYPSRPIRWTIGLGFIFFRRREATFADVL